MRGHISQAAVSGQDSFGVLYNNSTGPELLAVWNLQAGNNAAAQSYLVNSVQGIPSGATSGGFIETLYTGEAPLAGALYSGSVVSAPTASYEITQFPTAAFGWNQDKPLALIKPGWGLQVTENISNSIVHLSIVWSAVTADDLGSEAPGNAPLEVIVLD
jgi:hypothetical protein